MTLLTATLSWATEEIFGSVLSTITKAEDIARWHIGGLPVDPVCIDNGVIIEHSAQSMATHG